MLERSGKVLVLCKLLVAAVALVALVAVPARLLAPTLSIGNLLLYCAVGLAGVLALLIFAAVCSLQFSQFILRHGGTDPQWFWFSGEPKGLAALRNGQAVEGEHRAES
jgi:hypothetical protein